MHLLLAAFFFIYFLRSGACTHCRLSASVFLG